MRASANTAASAPTSRSHARTSTITTGRATWRTRPGSRGARWASRKLEALEAEIFAAWGEYAFHARLQGEETNCAGFDVERARLYRAGASAVGFDDEDELAQLSDGGVDLSGREVEILLPPEALRVLGRDFAFKHRLPKIALATRLIPDWEYPGYWLTKDNRDLSPAALADLLADHPAVSKAQLLALRGHQPG